MWMEESEVIESHRQAYLGHGPKNITQHYGTPRIVTEILKADADRMKAYLKSKSPPGSRVDLDVAHEFFDIPTLKAI
jgi:hypothetical protein